MTFVTVVLTGHPASKEIFASETLVKESQFDKIDIWLHECHEFDIHDLSLKLSVPGFFPCRTA